jgi:hypothetical protein
MAYDRYGHYNELLITRREYIPTVHIQSKSPTFQLYHNIIKFWTIL